MADEGSGAWGCDIVTGRRYRGYGFSGVTVRNALLQKVLLRMPMEKMKASASAGLRRPQACRPAQTVHRLRLAAVTWPALGYALRSMGSKHGYFVF